MIGAERNAGANPAPVPPLPDKVIEAATWLAEHWHVAPQPITRTLREMFGLEFLDACKAMAEARRIHDRGQA